MAYQLLRGDCLEILPTLEVRFDAIITDLPYGTTACAWDSIIPFAPMWEQVKRLLKPSGTFVSTSAQPFTTVLIASNFTWFKYELIWSKSIATGFLHAKNKPMLSHENIVIFSSGVTNHSVLSEGNRMTYNPQFTHGKPWKRKTTSINTGKLMHKPAKSETDFVGSVKESSGTRYPKSVLFFDEGNHNREHPTQKPVDLYEYLIKTYTNPGETVLDFCMGSGTTGVACVQTGREFIGIEKDPAYFAIAQKRLAGAMPPLFVETGPTLPAEVYNQSMFTG